MGWCNSCTTMNLIMSGLDDDGRRHRDDHHGVEVRGRRSENAQIMPTIQRFGRDKWAELNEEET